MTAANHPTPTVGVIDLPALSALLARGGYRVITGPDPRSAALAIDAESAAQEDTGFPIFVADRRWPGYRAWTERKAQDRPVVVVGLDEPSGVTISAARFVQAPLSLGQVLAPAGLGVHHTLSQTILDGQGAHAGAAPDFDVEVAGPSVPRPPADPPTEVSEAPPNPWDDEVSPHATDRQDVAPSPEPDGPIALPMTSPSTSDVAGEPTHIDKSAHTVSAARNPWDDPPGDVTPAPGDHQEPSHVRPDVDDTEGLELTYEVGAPDGPETWPAASTPAPVHDPRLADQGAATQPEASPSEDLSVFETDIPVTPGRRVADVPVDSTPNQEWPQSTAPTAGAKPGAHASTAPLVGTGADPELAPAPVAPLNDVFEPPYAPPGFVLPKADHTEPLTPRLEDDPYAAGPERPAPTPLVDAPVAPVVESPVRPVVEDRAAPVSTSRPDASPMDLPPVPAIVEPGETEVSGHPAPTHTEAVAQAEVLIVWAGKGGVGKSTTSVGVAQRAADAGLRVVLVDGNFGQGDLRTFLRIGMASLPSVYNFAATGDLRAALIDPPTLSQARDIKQEPINFAMVQAPPPHLADPDVVTPACYLHLVRQLRTMCDLVVIDTQIVEATDTSGMVDHFANPLMAEGAWGLGISDLSPPGIGNALTRLKRVAAERQALDPAGDPSERQMMMMNRVPVNIEFNRDGVAAAFNEHSTFLGVIPADTSVHEAMNRGQAPGSIPLFSVIVDAVLRRVYPDDARFRHRAEIEPDPAPEHRAGLFGRWRRKA